MSKKERKERDEEDARLVERVPTEGASEGESRGKKQERPSATSFSFFFRLFAAALSSSMVPPKVKRL